MLTQLRDTGYEADEAAETQAMASFSVEVIDFLEKEILDLQQRYRAREVSIAYLCKRTKLPPEVVFRIFNLPITNTIISAWLSIVVLVTISYLSTRKMKLIPSGIQNLE